MKNLFRKPKPEPAAPPPEPAAVSTLVDKPPAAPGTYLEYSLRPVTRANLAEVFRNAGNSGYSFCGFLDKWDMDAAIFSRPVSEPVPEPKPAPTEQPIESAS